MSYAQTSIMKKVNHDTIFYLNNNNKLDSSQPELLFDLKLHEPFVKHFLTTRIDFTTAQLTTFMRLARFHNYITLNKSLLIKKGCFHKQV
jgi:hypothetical protein